MSIADELNHLSGDIGDAYDAVDDMGGVIPAAKNMDNLDTAIRTIPQPTVNDGTLTIQKNGTNVATFTANQASNATANITVPTNTSDLNNDSGFITSSDVVTLYCYWGDSSDTFTPYYDAAHTQAVSFFDFVQLVRTKVVTLMWDDHDGFNYTQTIIATFVDSYDPTDPQDPPSSINFITAESQYYQGGGSLYEYTWNSEDSGFSSVGTDLIPKQNVWYATSFSVASSASKTAATSSYYPGQKPFSLHSGNIVFVKFVNANTATGDMYLDVDNTGSKQVYISGSSSDASYAWEIDDVVGFVYDGFNWHMLGGGKATTSYYGKVKIGTGYTSSDSSTVPTNAQLYEVLQIAQQGGSSYTAGNGISIDANNEISIDSSVVAEVSDIPTQTSDLTNNGSDGTSTYVEADELATVATSGSYTDLTNTPSIPAAQVNSDWNAVSGVAEILNKPSLATVATTGAYSDLSGTPTIPTVNDATLTITQNGTSVGTFTANASSNATIALTDTTYSAMTGATSGTAGTSGLVPAPAAGDESKVLSGAGTWVNQSSGQEKVFYYVGYANNDPGYSGRVLTLHSDAGMTTTATVQSMADDYFSGKEVHFCYVDTRNSKPIVDTIITTGAQRYEDSTTDTVFTFGSLFHGRNYLSSGVLNGYGTKSGTTVTVWFRMVPIVYDATLTIQHNGTNKGTFTANAQNNKTINIETIYADTPGTATTPAASVQASDIVWSTMPFNYSTTEVDTGCTWIDGKHIYKKTINFGALPNATSKTVAHGISNLDRIVKFEGVAKETPSNVQIMLPFVNTDAVGNQIYIRADQTNIAIGCGTNRSSFTNTYVTLWYTKTS